jgi:CheY-like chemotaxis protein
VYTERVILVADDSAVVLATLKRKLESSGRSVVTIASANAPVSAARLSCALLDLDLGDGFGTDIAARLRAESPTLSIAFLTSSPSDPRLADETVFEKPAGLEPAIAWALAHDPPTR